ncbi:uncharacterized protein C8Q71DRAFT_165061 [Rhodofomes roseus]|uniref:Uncharacterized protein n=1 Tax=Rhodofomes roseus TaxID=34475 RepID=A0A4Y9YQA1_9APHY|nr:uncharacterized protein C8Q71DRAFT_165061 [Rhodofomes roseus]KAH9834175.1 hypothetical protein C8Q71DRAFT_165061 [Rhodofomes roseus]TFY64332.1 hypothetical protein EVJ58_g2701 [Rhodofomes roseus]
MKSVAVLPILAASVLASSALIPTDVSSACSSYLNSFNQDTSLESCISPLVKATAQFGAGANSTSNPTSSAVSSALSSLCSATTCSSQTIRTQLANLYSACTAELTSSANKDVLRTYDVLYSIVPLQQAMCSKNSNGDYCVVAGSNSSSSSGTNDAASTATGESFSSISEYLYSDASSPSSVARRDNSQATISIVPNTTTFAENNILFLFLSPNLSSSELCTSCTRSVITAYTDFESNVPYAPGLQSSTLMSGQTALYKGIISTCGSSFMSGGAQAAGAISSGETSGAPPSIAVSAKAVSAVFGAAALAFFAML